MPTFSCASCGVKLRAPDTDAGKKGKCGQCQTMFVIPQSRSFPAGDAQSVGSDEAKLFEGLDMSRVMAATQSGAQGQSASHRPCRACGTMLAPSDAECPGCGALVQGRSSLHAEFSKPGTAMEPEAQRRLARKKKPKQKHRPVTMARPSKISIPAVIVGAVFMTLAVWAFVRGPAKTSYSSNARLGAKLIVPYMRYALPLIIMLIGPTLWIRACRPGLTFLRGAFVVLGSSIFYSGITLAILGLAYLEAPTGAGVFRGLLTIAAKLSIGYVLLKKGFWED